MAVSPASLSWSVEYEFISREGRVPGDLSSLQGRVNADGTKFAFGTVAQNFDATDTDLLTDIYYTRDPGTPLLVRASRKAGKGNASSLNPSISSACDEIGFASDASNFSSVDNNDARDIFLWTIDASGLVQLNLISQRFQGTTAANGTSDLPVIAANGGFAAFNSNATNISAVTLPQAGPPQVFVRSLASLSTGNAVLVSPIGATAGEQANANCGPPDISANGARVVFASSATNLADDPNDFDDIFLADLVNETMELISRGPNRTPSNGDSSGAFISEDGRYVAYTSDASNLVGGDTNGYGDAFRFDTKTGKTQLVSLTPAGDQLGRSGADPDTVVTDISPDGRCLLSTSPSPRD